MLLDTCALLWLVEGGGQLSQSVIEQIDLSPYVYISASTGFEISLTHRNGKLKLPVPPERRKSYVYKNDYDLLERREILAWEAF